MVIKPVMQLLAHHERYMYDCVTSRTCRGITAWRDNLKFN